MKNHNEPYAVTKEMRNYAPDKKDIYSDFILYLSTIGAEIVETKSEWEDFRFVLGKRVLVVYKNKKGSRSFSCPIAEDIYKAFSNGHIFKLTSIVGKSSNTRNLKNIRSHLLKRDGHKCFYTQEQLNKENTTIEHLIPVCRGGKYNLENLVLCTKDANTKVANLPLAEKLKFREANLKMIADKLKAEKQLLELSCNQKIKYLEKTNLVNKIIIAVLTTIIIITYVPMLKI
jgi:hypothetical protein